MLIAEATMTTVFICLIVFSAIVIVATGIIIASTITSDGFKKNFRLRDSKRVAEARADLEVIELRTRTASKQIELDKLTEQRITRATQPIEPIQALPEPEPVEKQRLASGTVLRGGRHYG